MKGSILGLAAVAGLALAGCDDMHVSFGHHGGQWGSGVKGSGNVKTETRDVANFHSLKAGGALHIKLQVGTATSFKIEGEDNILPLIKSEVKDGQLLIYTEKSINPKKDINVTLTTPNIDDLDISGASQLDATGLKADSLNLDFSGASKITLDGAGKDVVVDFSGASEVTIDGLHAQKISGELSGASHLTAKGSIDLVELELSGASEADLYHAPGKNGKITLSGASTMKIVASEGLEADLSGASDLKYKASHNVHIHKDGASDSHQID